MASPLFSNHLVHEKSPYLLQHAHNPVDWYPWGQEAFDLAKSSDKPIFLSIGYATCHWCHVMERESFSDPEIAKLMNDVFVCIKVDREELPQVDNIYMEFAQALMSTAGGWPLNLILTPDLKPFFAITYLPPINRRGMMGMRQFVQQINQLWHSEERQHLVDQAEKIVEIFEETAEPKGDAVPTAEILAKAVETLFELTDPVYGGLKGEPKFPLGYQSEFFLEYSRSKGDSRSLFCAELTLDMMARGGIYDQIGGGFSRYAVDEKWTLPHFEKMLYDNALLAGAYLQAWKYTKKESYRSVCQETLDYILRELTHPEGGFYSAEDADSEGQEGRFYTWTMQEAREALSDKEAEIFCNYFGLKAEGNFEGRNVLHAAASAEAASPILKTAKEKMLQKRQSRPRPFKDDKIIVSWNGLMIDAMIRAAHPLKRPQYKEAAIKAATFIKAHLWKEGRLLRRWRDGQARFPGGIDDYAFLVRALISMFEEGCGSEWLQWAFELSEVLEKEFKAENGAFYSSMEDPYLLIRKCEFYDGAEPSGNAVHCENLLRLYQLTQDGKYLAGAEGILKAAKPSIEIYPPGACYHLIALQRYLDLKAATVWIALDEKGTMKEEIQDFLSAHFHPHAMIIWKAVGDPHLPGHVDKNPIDGQTAIYICRQNICEAPLIDRGAMMQALEKI